MQKRRIAGFLLLFALIFVAALYLGASVGKQAEDKRVNRLRLTLMVSSQRYCGDPGQTKEEAAEEKRGSAEFKLRLSMRNITDRPVILCKVCLLDIGPHVLPVNADGTPGNPLFNLNTDAAVYDPAPEFSRGPNGNYVVLRPNENYETDQETWVPVAFTDSRPRYKGYVTPGRYFLRAIYSTWYQSLKETESFRRRWQSFGDLVDEVLESDPVPIEIHSPQDIPGCSADSRENGDDWGAASR